MKAVGVCFDLRRLKVGGIFLKPFPCFRDRHSGMTLMKKALTIFLSTKLKMRPDHSIGLCTLFDEANVNEVSFCLLIFGETQILGYVWCVSAGEKVCLCHALRYRRKVRSNFYTKFIDR